MEKTNLPHEGFGQVFLVDPSPVLSYRVRTRSNMLQFLDIKVIIALFSDWK